MSIEPVCRGHFGVRGRSVSRCGVSRGLIQMCSVGHTVFGQQFAVAKGAEGVPVADQ